jgi:hypothetical protein
MCVSCEGLVSSTYKNSKAIPVTSRGGPYVCSCDERGAFTYKKVKLSQSRAVVVRMCVSCEVRTSPTNKQTNSVALSPRANYTD